MPCRLRSKQIDLRIRFPWKGLKLAWFVKQLVQQQQLETQTGRSALVPIKAIAAMAKKKGSQNEVARMELVGA